MKLTRAKFESLVDDLVQRTVEPVQGGAQGCRPQGRRDRRGDPGRRHDPHAQGPGRRQGVLRQGAAQGRQPGRGRRARRRHPGRRAAGRRQGRAAARRDPAVARHRDAGRRVHPPDRPQHDDPDQEVPGLLDRRGQPVGGDDPRLPGRARDGGRQQVARPVRPDRHSAGTARRAADRGHLRHRRQRHRQRLGQGQGHRQGAADPHPGLRRPVDDDIEHMVKDAEAHAEEDKKQREASRPRTRPKASSIRPRSRWRNMATRSGRGQGGHRDRPSPTSRRPLEGDDAEDDQGKDRRRWPKPR